MFRACRVENESASRRVSSPKILKSRWLSALMLSMCFLVINMTCQAEEFRDDYNLGLGPLSLSTTSPGQSLRFTLPSIIPGQIKPGWGFRINTSTSNVWLNEPEFLLDFEIFDTNVAASYGFNNRLGIMTFFNQRKFYGGILDGSIERFHDWFGLEQDGRNEWPQYKTHVILKDEQGKTIVHEDDVGSSLNNNGLGMGLHYVLDFGGKRMPAVGVTAMVRYGLEGPEGPGRPLDLGLGLGLSKRIAKRWYAYGHLGYTHYGQTEYDTFVNEFEENSFSGMATIAWHLKPNLSTLVQYQVHEGAVKNFGTFSNPAHEVTLGFKWLMPHGGVFEFGLIENFIIIDNSSDFGIHIGYGYSL